MHLSVTTVEVITSERKKKVKKMDSCTDLVEYSRF
jgi:hypothetical protein